MILYLKYNNKKSFHAFLFNIRICSPEIINVNARGLIPVLNKKKYGIFVLLYATNTIQDLGR